MKASGMERAAAQQACRRPAEQFALFKPVVRPLRFDPVLMECGPTKATHAVIAQYQTEDALINAALSVLREQMTSTCACLSAPEAIRSYLRLNLARLEYEAFWCVFLGSRSQVLAIREMARGTLAEFVAYPREVVKAALQVNAAAVIFAHNHPSGVAEPSRADEMLTSTLKHALSLVDVRALDHFVIGRDAAVSFVERGLL